MTITILSISRSPIVSTGIGKAVQRSSVALQIQVNLESPSVVPSHLAHLSALLPDSMRRKFPQISEKSWRQERFSSHLPLLHRYSLCILVLTERLRNLVRI